ncbi:hypothetical protein [Winogradskyella jejuensis]|uniref:Uncharacterized protein n=1 Tax=Winogradskyella jejuensis TaxID=1089305 RepID=A0A1M5TVI7_9FLAO|nr:hypothetical protein [Winogradskyella jejuensis]SHH54825.1 hypothetical protein SAMN05444148_2284 [Winogradskyella jejuensis]
MKNIYISLILFGIIGLFLSILDFIEYLKYEKIRPKRIEKWLDLKPFSDFKMKKFEKQNSYYRGIINNYFVLVGIEWEDYQKNPSYYLKVLFNPYSKDKIMSFNHFIKKNDFGNTDYFNDLQSLNKYYNKKEFSKINYIDLNREINKMIDYLVKNNFKSISLVKWNKSKDYVCEVKEDYLKRV